jgi:hypothetical protein
MRYMMFIKHAENYRMEDVPQSLFTAMGQMVEEGFKSGHLVDTAGLQRTEKGFRVRLSKGKISTTDGPFTEAKEVVGGYAIVNAKDRKDAEQFATKFMQVHKDHWPVFEGECEVRPLEEEAQA